MDIPNNRSSHSIPTPRGGGIAIVLTWFAGLIYFFYTNQIDEELFYAFLSGIILVIVSFLDDIYNIKPTVRFGAQIITAGIALFFVNGSQIIDLGFYKMQNEWILSTIAFLSILWFINLYNFLDGIDGYAAMETVFLSISMFYFTNSNLYILLGIATLGFLIWNWQPAKIFMGDIGSTLLGFNLIILALYFQNINNTSLIIFIILSSLFWFDATLTLFRRWKNKEQLSKAHKKHAYQRIVQVGFSHQKTVLYAIIINIINFILAYLAVKYNKFSILFLILNIGTLYLITTIIDKRKKFE